MVTPSAATRAARVAVLTLFARSMNLCGASGQSKLVAGGNTGSGQGGLLRVPPHAGRHRSREKSSARVNTGYHLEGRRCVLSQARRYSEYRRVLKITEELEPLDVSQMPGRVGEHVDIDARMGSPVRSDMSWARDRDPHSGRSHLREEGAAGHAPRRHSLFCATNVALARNRVSKEARTRCITSSVFENGTPV